MVENLPVLLICLNLVLQYLVNKDVVKKWL